MQRLICTKSKLEHSLSRELTELTIDEVKERLGKLTGLTLKDVGIIFLMMQRGLTLEQISEETGVEFKVLKQFLPEILTEKVETQTDSLADQGKRTLKPALDLERDPCQLPCLAFLMTARPRAGHLLRRLRKPNSLTLHNPPRRSSNLSTSLPLPSSAAANSTQTSCPELISLEKRPLMEF
jgi:hypothetical protein